MAKKTGIRIITPKPFRNISGFLDDKGNREIKTKAEAKLVIAEFDKDMESYMEGKYMGKCKAVRVTEIIEELKLD